MYHMVLKAQTKYYFGKKFKVQEVKINVKLNLD